ncbi:hypothetical protein ACP4OV_025506 [Aristida adscensionis]
MATAAYCSIAARDVHGGGCLLHGHADSDLLLATCKVHGNGSCSCPLVEMAMATMTAMAMGPIAMAYLQSVNGTNDAQIKAKPYWQYRTSRSRPKPTQIAERHDIRSEEGDIVSHFALWHTEPGKFYGLRAEIAIWGSPNQESTQASGASILVACDDGGLPVIIEAGFHVAPFLYNNNRDVRFFTFWTRDDWRTTGCYNLICPGFVPANGAALTPGQAVAPPSSYDGEDRYIRISLNKDPNSGDWVLYRHDLDNPSFLGHFPGDLCPQTPRVLAFQGYVNYPKNGQGPPMGSGHFPEEDDKKSAYFKHIKLIDSKGHAVDPITTHMISVVDRPDCYNETGVLVIIHKGYMFYYGGPPGCIG